MKNTIKSDIKNVGKSLVGEVISNKMDKTIVVQVARTLRHPVYGKVIRRNKKYQVHDEQNVASVGDVVEIAHCRPLSKLKHMVLNRVIKQD